MSRLPPTVYIEARMNATFLRSGSRLGDGEARPVDIASATVAAMAVASLVPSPSRWWSVLIAVVGPWLHTAVQDSRTGRIPNASVLACAAPAIVLWVRLVAGPGPFQSGFEGSVAASRLATGVVCLAAPLLILHLTSPAALGFGDVKLAIALSPAIAIVAPAFGLLALWLASAAALWCAVRAERSAVPFGPSLIAGSIAALLVGGLLSKGVTV